AAITVERSLDCELRLVDASVVFTWCTVVWTEPVAPVPPELPLMATGLLMAVEVAGPVLPVLVAVEDEMTSPELPDCAVGVTTSLEPPPDPPLTLTPLVELPPVVFWAAAVPGANRMAREAGEEAQVTPPHREEAPVPVVALALDHAHVAAEGLQTRIVGVGLEHGEVDDDVIRGSGLVAVVGAHVTRRAGQEAVDRDPV